MAPTEVNKMIRIRLQFKSGVDSTFEKILFKHQYGSKKADGGFRSKTWFLLTTI
jgi:hypothetical protein